MSVSSSKPYLLNSLLFWEVFVKNLKCENQGRVLLVQTVLRPCCPIHSPSRDATPLQSGRVCYLFTAWIETTKGKMMRRGGALNSWFPVCPRQKQQLKQNYWSVVIIIHVIEPCRRIARLNTLSVSCACNACPQHAVHMHLIRSIIS